MRPAPSWSARATKPPPKSRTTSLSLKMYQLRLVGHAEISTEHYHWCVTLRGRHGVATSAHSHRWTRHSRHVRASDWIIAADLVLSCSHRLMSVLE